MSGRKLGRGLDVLISRGSRSRKDEAVGPSPPVGPPQDLTAPSRPATPFGEDIEGPKGLIEVDPRSVEANPEQPRKSFAEHELEDLKTSIAQEGLLQPVLVRRVGDRFQLIAGERRLRAAQELDLQRIPAIVAELEDDRLLEVALIENIQREDLNPIEVARAYRQLMTAKGWTQEALARSLGIGRSAVANTLRLLELPEEMRDALVREHITTGHAKVLLSVEHPEEQRALFERIAEERLSVRELEDATRERSEPEPGETPRPTRKPSPKRSARIVHLEEELSRAVGTRVSIFEARGSKGKGRVSVEFYSTEDFERIRALLLGE